MEIPSPHPHLQQVVGQVLGHLLGERGNQHPLLHFDTLLDLIEQIVDLALGGLDDDLGVHQPGGADDLFDDLAGVLQLPTARRRRQQDRLVGSLEPFVEPEGPIVHGREEPESMLDENLLATSVALVLAVKLWDGHMALVENHEEVVREVVHQGVRRLSRLPPVQVSRVILDAVAVTELPHHLEVVCGTHAKPLSLQQLVPFFEPLEPFCQFQFDRGRRRLNALVGGDVMGGGVDDHLPQFAYHLARHRVHLQHSFYFVTEILDSHQGLLVRREHLEGVSLDPEFPPGEVHLVSLVLDVHQLPNGIGQRELDSLDQAQQLPLVLLRATESVDGRHRGHDDHIASGEQRRGGRVSKAVDLVVDARVLLYVGVALGEVRLGLVVVVIRDEVLDSIVGEELPELVGELRSQGLVGGQHQSGTLNGLDEPCDGGRLARPGDSHEGLEPIAPRHSGS